MSTGIAHDLIDAGGINDCATAHRGFTRYFRTLRDGSGNAFRLRRSHLAVTGIAT
jgi:hypothetical protein